MRYSPFNFVYRVYIYLSKVCNFISYPHSHVVPASAPQAPSSISSSRSVSLTWLPPPPEDWNGPLLGYSIVIRQLDNGDTKEYFSNTIATTIDSLQPHTSYVVFLSAQTSAGNGPVTNPISVITGEEGIIM